MLTLTQTAFYTRQTVKYGTLFVIFLVIARIVFSLGLGVYRRINPPPPPPPETAFGKLPALPFPANDKSSAKYTFSLETPTGQLPEFPTTQSVYFMPKAESSFLALDEAEEIAKRLGFSGKATAASETIYSFEHPSSPAILEMNIINKTFSISYNLAATPEVLSKRPASTQEALSRILSFLRSADLLPEDLENGEKSFDFLAAQAGNLVETVSLSEANFVRVNIARSSYSELPVKTPNRKLTNVWFLVSGESSRGREIIAGEYHYFPVDQGTSSTYPIKEAQAGFDELKSGKAFVVSGPEPDSGATVTIRRVYLAYYESGQPQEYLQPIVVFEGDQEFLAYVPAVTAEFYSQE